MYFMKLNVESIHFKADRVLLSFIDDKINKLKEHHEEIINGDVILKLDSKHNKVVEIKLHCNGCYFYAKKISDTFEKSTDQVVEALRRQLRKHRTKITGK